MNDNYKYHQSGDVANRSYLREVVTELLNRYDAHDITKAQFIEKLTSLKAEVDVVVDISSGIPNPHLEVKLRLNNDIFGEYSNNDPVDHWSKIMDCVNKGKES